MYSGILFGMLLGLVFLPHLRCYGNIEDGTARKYQNVKSNMGSSVRPRDVLHQDFFQNLQTHPSSSSQSQGPHSSLVAPGLSQLLPSGHTFSYQTSSRSKGVWPASTSSTLFRTAGSEFSAHGLQYSSETMKSHSSQSRTNIAKPSIVSSGGIIIKQEHSQGEPSDPSGGGKHPVYGTRTEPRPSNPHGSSQFSQSSRKIWPGTTTLSTFQRETLVSSSDQKSEYKRNFRQKKPSRSYFTPPNHFVASSGAIRLVDVVNPSASDGRGLITLSSLDAPSPKELGASSEITYGFKSGQPVQNARQAEQTRFGSPAQHVSLPTGRKVSGIHDGTSNSKCVLHIPSNYGQGSIRRCPIHGGSSNQDLHQNQGSTDSTLKTLMPEILSRKMLAGSSDIVPDATRPLAVENPNPSMLSSHVTKFGTGKQILQSQDSFRRVTVSSSSVNAHAPDQRLSMPALPSSNNVYLPGVGSPQSSTQTRCEGRGSVPAPGSAVPLTLERRKLF